MLVNCLKREFTTNKISFNVSNAHLQNRNTDISLEYFFTYSHFSRAQMNNLNPISMERHKLINQSIKLYYEM